jgi:hypothetical protein
LQKEVVGLALNCGDGVGLLEAWRVWFSGDSTEHLMVCGSSLLWWGRIGKVIEFVSGLYIVAEIVGENRIKAFGCSIKSLRNVVPFSRIADSVRKRLIFGAVVAAILLTILVAFGYCFFGFGWSGCWRVYHCTPGEGPTPPDCSLEEQRDIQSIGIRILIGSASPIAVVLLIAFIIGVIIPDFILRPLAWILHKDLSWTKAMSLLLLAVGFHFDLLAS